MIRRASTIIRPTAPPAPIDVRDLRPYQAEGARWLRDRLAARKNALLGDEMGLGKTAQALRALPSRARALVVCPASVALVWREETRTWRPDLSPVAFDGRAPRESEIAIISYDSLPPVNRRRPFLIDDDMSQVQLIFDEAHRAKNADALRTQRVRRLVNQCGRGRTWGLSGTPMAGTPDDLRGLLVSLGLFAEAFPGGGETPAPQQELPGLSSPTHVEDSSDEFNRLCKRTERRVFNKRTGRSGTVAEFGEITIEAAARVRRVMLRRKRADQIELPPVQRIDVVGPAPTDLRHHLDEMTGAWDDYDPASLPPFELFSAATKALARSRCDAAVDLARDVARERPLIVFSAHLGPIDAITRAIPGAVRVTGEDSDADQERAIAAFRSGRSRVIGITIQLGEGLNLPEAGAVILVDETFRPSQTDQAIDRALRPGQVHDRVIVYRMTTDHPLDQRIRAIHAEMRRLSAEMIG